MEELVGKVKDMAKSFLKKASKPFLFGSIGLLLIAALVVVIIIEDSSYKEGDKSNTPYVVGQHTSSVYIDESGNVSTSMTAQELWDQMLKDGSRVDEYLDGPEELQKLMNAQMITDYLDTRPNPDADIDWDALNKDVNSGKTQGIVKLKRANSDGVTKTMTYVSPETFEMYIDNYNSSGSEADKQIALSHFTLEKGYVSSSSVSTPSPESEEDAGTEDTGEDTSETEGDDEEENNATIGEGLMCWPATTTNITSPFGYRIHPIHGDKRLHKGIDIAGMPNGADIYATESGKVIGAGWDAGGGNIITIDHGNGYLSKYMHNTELIASVGQQVTKGQVIAKAGSTGQSTGTHLHFQIEYNGVPVDPMTFKYENGLGSGTGGIGSSVDGSSTLIDAKYYAKVATWKETNEIIESDDPLVETTPPEGNPEYYMSTTKIDYEPYVSEYRMHFDYLWALLVVSQDKDFVLDLADLVYDSEIEITVHDNLSINTSVAVDIRTDTIKAEAEYVDIGVKYDGLEEEIVKNIDPFTKEIPKTYTTTTISVIKNNTLNISLTKAKVWIADYEQEFTYQGPEITPTNSNDEYGDEDYPAEPYEIDCLDKLGLAELKRQGIHNEYVNLGIYENIETRVIRSKFLYYQKSQGIKTVNTTLETRKYISSPAKTVEKTDKESDEDNFVTIFLDNKEARSNIISATEILFEILEKGPNTVEYLDLTKYLLYKATGKSYGVTEYSITIVSLTSANRVKGDALENYIKLWENGALWKYDTGQTNDLPARYISEDGQNYICYEDGSGGHNNVAYGLATFISDSSRSEVHEPYGKGYYNHVEGYAKHGIDVKTFYEGALVDKQATLEVLRGAIDARKQWVENYLATYLPEYELSQTQIDSLVAVCYQMGNTYGFADAYKKCLNDDGTVNAEKIRTEFVLDDGTGRNIRPFNYSSTVNDRKYANWVLFTQGKYINANGEEVIMGATLVDWEGDSYSSDDYTYPVYNQYDPKWVSHPFGGPCGKPSVPANGGVQKTIGTSGCSACALAMIISGYTGDVISPDILVQKLDELYPSGIYYSSGVGGNAYVYSSKVLEEYGCSLATTSSRSQAMEALNKGYAVLGYEEGHYLAFVPASSEDVAQGYVFKILDSARGHDKLCRDFTDADNIVKGNSGVLAIIYPSIN